MAFKEFTGELDKEESSPTGYQEFSGNLDPPSIGKVALNAIPKGIANFLNTPNTINSLVLKGVAAIPGMPKSITDLAENPLLNRNGPMEFAKKMGLIKSENDPQTLPQRIVDTAIQAGVGSAIVPGGGLVNTLKQGAVGAVSGGVGQGVKEFTDSPLLGGLAGMISPLLLKAGTDFLGSAKKILLNDTAKVTLRDARNFGFVVEPSQVRQPSSKLETIAGKAAIAQGAVERNQEVANRLAAQAVGLPPETPLSPDILKTLKDHTMRPYREVDEVFKLLKQDGRLSYFPRYHADSLMDEYIEAGQRARAMWKSYIRDPKIDMLQAAKAADKETESVFKDIQMIARESGRFGLADKVLQAKQQYAKINDIESSMNVGTGNISMPLLGSMLDKGKPLSGELKIIAKFANAFPRATREIERTPPSGFSGSDAASASVLGSLGMISSGSPSGLALAGLPLLRGPARNRLLSEAYQRKLLDQPRLNLGLDINPLTVKTASGMAGKTLYDKRDEE